MTYISGYSTSLLFETQVPLQLSLIIEVLGTKKSGFKLYDLELSNFFSAHSHFTWLDEDMMSQRKL